MEFKIIGGNMKKTFYSIATFFLICYTFFSCSSLQQDVVISTVPKNEISELENIEFRITHLDSKKLLCSATDYSTLTQINQTAQDILSDLSKLLNNKNLQQAAQSRLIALKGRLFEIQNKTQEATECYNLSNSIYKGDIQNQILGYRLSIIKNITDINAHSSEKDLVLIEQAISYFKENNYSSSVAKFDEAFISCEDFYKDAYSTIRDIAWNNHSLKNLDSSSDLISVKELTIGQMMMIAQNYPQVLNYYTSGNVYSETMLFRKLVQQGLLTSTFNENPPKKIYPYTKLTKSMAARFFWNLHCNKTDNIELKTKFSTYYKKEKSKSPVKDVSISHEDFDAILGCIQYRYFTLDDGVNFNPDNFVSGAEIAKALQRMK